MIRKKAFGIFGGFLAVMLIFTILSRAASGAAMARVETVKISTGTVDHKVSASGRVEAGKEIAVYTESSQRVQDICVQEGQMVEEGTVLFQIDLSELEEQITEAQLNMEKTRLQNQDIQNTRNQEQQDQALARNRAAEDYDSAVSQGDHSVAEAKNAWETAEQELQNFLNEGVAGVSYSESGEAMPDERSQAEQVKDVVEGKETDSEWEIKKSELEHKVADAKRTYEETVESNNNNIQAAKRALEDASKGITSDSTLEQYEITRQQEELSLNKLLELQAAEGKIKAPVRGIVTKIMITVGDFTSEGTAVRMADVSGESYLTVAVDRADEEYISQGSNVEIEASGKKEKLSNYTVTSITENKEDPTQLDVRIDLPKGILEAGTLADVEIIQKPENYVATLPVEALHEESKGYYVLVLEEEQGVLGMELAVRRLDVEILDKNGTVAALAEGVLSGEQEVVRGSNRIIKEGERVRKKEA